MGHLLEEITKVAPWKSLDPRAMGNRLPGYIQEVKEGIERACALPHFSVEQAEAALEKVAALTQELHEWWAPLSHLKEVEDHPLLREVIQETEPLWSQFDLWLTHYLPVYRLAQSLLQQGEFAPERRRALAFWVASCELSGIHLSDSVKQEIGEIQSRLAQLSLEFSNHLIDAQASLRLTIQTETQLEGLPESLLQTLYQPEQSAWVLPVTPPVFMEVMEKAKDRALRASFYRAFVTRASALGEAPQYDNGPLIPEILQLRQRLAALLGFEDFASMVLKLRSLNAPSAVQSFQQSLLEALNEAPRREYEALEAFGRERLGLSKLEAWDVSHVASLWELEKHGLDQEKVRDYFPASRVLSGLFSLLGQLFGLEVRLHESAEVWNPEVQLVEFLDQATARSVGAIYFDLYARESKQSGAWAQTLYDLKPTERGERRPVALVQCNVLKESGGESYWTHEQVVTLFHEVGHALQIIFTESPVFPIYGISGVPWDVVEVASQLLENWAWEPSVLRSMSRHRVTGAALPEEWIEKLRASRHFFPALSLSRQLRYGLFDMACHLKSMGSSPSEEEVLEVWRAIQHRYAPAPEPEFVRFPHTFSHLFAGGYAVGYYGYLWSELLSSELFEAFLEQGGPFDSEVAARVKALFLVQRAACDPMEGFLQFRGRSPRIEALLRARGIAPVPEGRQRDHG